MFLLYVVVALTWLAVFGVTVASVAALFRRWTFVVRIARVAAFLGGCVVAVLVVLTVFFAFAPQTLLRLLPKAAEDPSQKARLLAEWISELMNCGALAVLAGLIAALLWAFASWRNRLRTA
jgi:hypothetical protein